MRFEIPTSFFQLLGDKVKLEVGDLPETFNNFL